KDDIFDILIGVDSLKRNRFDINLVNDTLYYIDENEHPIKLSDLLYDVNSASSNSFTTSEDELNYDSQSPILFTITVTNENENRINNIILKENIIDETILTLPPE
ncbi:hypothetical protein PIROE2DRAFT_19082, partial [Piromyces sp. E2]